MINSVKIIYVEKKYLDGCRLACKQERVSYVAPRERNCMRLRVRVY